MTTNLPENKTVNINDIFTRKPHLLQRPIKNVVPENLNTKTQFPEAEPKPILSKEITFQERNKNVKKEAEYLMFVEYIATPSTFKQFKSQRDFGKHYNISEATLSDWKLRPGFYDLVSRKIKTVCRDKTPDLIDAWYYQMLTSEKPIGRDMLIWLQYTEGYMPKVSYEQTVISPSDFDPH